jgi:phosphoadenosine phosphosulfate reductase
MAGVKFDAHFNLTTVDPPELVRFVKQNYPNVQIHRPEKTMWKLIETNGPPSRIFRFCCRELKETGGAGRVVVTGVRWQESTKRAKRRMIETCYQDSTKQFFNPIIDWDVSEVWEFLNDQGISHCSLYDEGFSRIGCIGCPMSGVKGFKRDFERWPKYHAAYLRAFARMLKGRLERGNPWRGKPETTAEQVMAWWANRASKGDPDQAIMFE